MNSPIELPRTPPDKDAPGPIGRLLRRTGIHPLLGRLQLAGLARRRRRLLARLEAESLASRGMRVLATATWNFPIYSQTFVYQELLSLMEAGFDLRLTYSRLEPRDRLPARFAPLWERKRPLHLHWGLHRRDLEWFLRHDRERVEGLIDRVGGAAGMKREALLRERHFLEAFSFARLAAAFRPHYIHSYFFYQHALYALVAGFLLDIPRGVTCYADHMLRDYPLKLVPLHLESCDLVLATSARIKEELLALAPRMDPEKVLIKPNAVDTTFFPRRERAEPGPGEPFRLISVNRIEPKKGLSHLVEAVAILHRQGLPIRLDILGEADRGIAASRACRDALAAQVARAGLGKVVFLRGRAPQEEVRRRLEEAHLFLAPFVQTPEGDKDGIPTALLEALATGLPAVVTDAGSMGEVVRDGEEGLLVPQGNAAALARALADLLGDPARRREMGRRGAAQVEAHYSLQACEDLFHRRVRRLVEERAGRGCGSDRGA